MPREKRPTCDVQFSLRLPQSLADKLRDLGAKRDIPVSAQKLAILLIEQGIDADRQSRRSNKKDPT